MSEQRGSTSTAIQESVARIERALYGDGFHMVQIDCYIAPTSGQPYPLVWLDEVVQEVSAMPCDETLFEAMLAVMKREKVWFVKDRADRVSRYEISSWAAASADSAYHTVFSEIHSMHVDVEALKNRSDNLLNVPDIPVEGWKSGYDHSSAKFLAQRGKASMFPSDYYFGRMDERFSTDDYKAFRPELGEIVAMFKLEEETYGEFESTMSEESRTVTTVSAEVVFASGHCRDIYFEGTVGEFVRAITADSTNKA